MDDKMKNFIVHNWNAYHLVSSKEEFISLINILEAHGESVDSLHHAVINGYQEYLSILSFDGWETDRELVESIFAHNVFYPSFDALRVAFVENEWANENASLSSLLESGEDIRQTQDGFVHVLWY